MNIQTTQPAAPSEHVEHGHSAAEQRTRRFDLMLMAAYGLALLAYALATPLQVPEFEAVAWSVHFNWNDFWYWSAQATDPSPIANLIQLPFVHFLGVSRLVTRLPGILLACGSAYLLLRLANRIVPKRRYAALALFVALPLQLMILTASVQYEAATLLSIAAMLAFFTVMDNPGFKPAVVLAVLTGLALYTDHHSAVPILGAVLFLLRFSPRAQERKALWYALGACVASVLPYLPYYFWSTLQTNRHWVAEPGIPTTTFPPDMTPLQMVLLGVAVILLAGALLGGYASFGMNEARIHRRISVFCLLGSVILTLLWLIVPSYYSGSAIIPQDLMFAAVPGILIFTAALHWLLRRTVLAAARSATIGAAVLTLLVFLGADFELIAMPKGNLALEATYVAPELQRDSCVVFVTESFSRPMFFLLQPKLEQRECGEFFHQRIVLASHPYVTPEQQHSAEGFFKGLNFQEVKRIHSGGGEIVVFEAR